MDDVNTQPAESSPAAQAAPEAESLPDFRTFRQEQNDRAMGKETPRPPKPSEPAPEKESSDEGTPEPEKAAESEPAKKQEPQHKPSKAEQRLNELLEDLRRAGLSPAELKTFKREAQRAAEPSKEAPERTEKPKGLEAPQKPKPDEYENWDKYEEARDKYFEDLADFKAAKRLEDFRQQQAQESAQRELQTAIKAASDRYGKDVSKEIGSTATAIFEDRQISPVVKALVNESPVMVDLLYVAGSNAEEFGQFIADARTNPGAAVRKMVLLERLVQEELSKGSNPAPQRGEDGKFVSSQKAPEKKTTEAPPPPREVSGRGAAPPDDVESAAAAGDFRRYRDAANRREIARQQGR